MMTRTEVLDRLKNTHLPDCELDKEIALAAGWGFRSGGWYPPEILERARKAKQAPRHFGSGGALPYFTRSADRAAPLIPKGMRRRTIVMEDGRAAVQLCWPGDDWPTELGTLYASEALAIAIAVLELMTGETQ